MLTKAFSELKISVSISIGVKLFMKLQYSELDNSIRLIKLIGTLDLTGAYGIEVEFVRRCEGENVRVLVDLSEVDYISSIGVHMLVSAANSVARHRGKMVLFSPQRKVMDVLELTGISQLVPVYPELGAAKVGVFAA